MRFKFAKKLITPVLTAGVVASIGGLSFVGMLLISPSMPLATLAFIFAGFEGEVYRQNIIEGLAQFKYVGKEALKHFLILELEKEVKLKNTERCQFLNEYAQQQKKIKKFKNKNLTEVQKENYHLAKRRLKYMQHFYAERVLSPNADFEYGDDKVENVKFNDFIQNQKDKIPALKEKINWLRASSPIVIGSSIGSGFVTATAIHSSLLALSAKFAFVLTTAALSGMIWPLAAFAAIGYVFLIYHTICDIIKDDLAKKWFEKAKSWFLRKEHEKNVTFLFRIGATGLFCAVILALNITAMVISAGAWWKMLKFGVNFLVPIMATGQLLFAVKNSFETIKSFRKFSFNNPFKRIKNKIMKTWERESILQFFNPFRLITAPIIAVFDLLAFVGHIVAMGATLDKFRNLKPAIALSIVGGSDAAQDAEKFFPKGDHQKKDKSKKDDHEHAVLPKLFIHTILCVPLFLSAIWDYAFSRLNKEPKVYLAFSDCLRKNFHIEAKKTYSEAADTQESSTAWLKHEINHRFTKQRKKLETVHASDKKGVLESLVKQITNQIDVPKIDKKYSPLNEKQNKQIDQHRHFHLFKTTTRTRRFVDKIEHDYGLKKARA